MRRLTGVGSALAIAAVLGVTGFTQSYAAPFDGAWSVMIQTTEGKCGSYRAALDITGGQVSSQAGDYAVSGSVNASGAVAVTVINNEGTATGTGRLRGAAGSGQWRSSTGECAGTWTATKRS